MTPLEFSMALGAVIGAVFGLGSLIARHIDTRIKHDPRNPSL